ncbi:MAG: cytochrome C oxidase subunit II [Candidatus Dadabacteria bacterium]|nr:MAG: cytochrome C oxidase subunit II [Candidatus Dadabacteria bacterium]
MSIYPPKEGWFRKPEAGEKTWLAFAVLWCVVLSIMMPYWHFKGKQNSLGISYRVKIGDFIQRAEKFKAAYKVGEEKGIAIVEPPPGSNVYLIARMWSWDPILKLKENQTYKLHVSSLDLQHGFSVQPVNINFQVLPGYDHVIEITPRNKGVYYIICNEFCGIGHHTMVGKIIVE